MINFNPGAIYVYNQDGTAIVLSNAKTSLIMFQTIVIIHFTC